MTSDVDHAAVMQAPMGLLGNRLSGGGAGVFTGRRDGDAPAIKTWLLDQEWRGP